MRVASVRIDCKRNGVLSCLMMVRADNGKWTFPGGGMDEGEQPEAAAAREVFEEVGIKLSPKDLKLVTVETLSGRSGNPVTVWAYHADVEEDTEISSKNDPDKETKFAMWVPLRDGRIPAFIAKDLHSPKNVICEAFDMMPKDPVTVRLEQIQGLVKSEGEFHIPEDEVTATLAGPVPSLAYKMHTFDVGHLCWLAQQDEAVCLRGLQAMPQGLLARCGEGGVVRLLSMLPNAALEFIARTKLDGCSFAVGVELGRLALEGRLSVGGLSQQFQLHLPLLPPDRDLVWGDSKPNVLVDGIWAGLAQVSSIAPLENPLVLFWRVHGDWAPTDITEMVLSNWIERYMRWDFVPQLPLPLAKPLWPVWIMSLRGLPAALAHVCGEHLIDDRCLPEQMTQQAMHFVDLARLRPIGMALRQGDVEGDASYPTEELREAVEAVKSLGGIVANPRACFFQQEGNALLGAIASAGWDTSSIQIQAAVMAAITMQRKMAKSEVLPLPDESSLDVGMEIKQAYGSAEPVVLQGRHVAGSLLVSTPNFGRWLLKSGSGGAGPAAGAKQETAPPALREMAFYEVAKLWGLGDFFPAVMPLLIDDDMFAAIQWLEPAEWEPVHQFARTEPGKLAGAMDVQRQNGILVRWAVLDWVLGNPDRHANNMLISTKTYDIALIDHGSAFAGSQFSPGTDTRSFVPFYLRYMIPQGNMTKMTASEKLRYMPTLPVHKQQEAVAWLRGLSLVQMRETIHRWGIQGDESVRRLRELQQLCGADLSQLINAKWVGI